MQLSSKNPVMRLLAFFTVVIVFGGAWYLLSPLFFDRQVSEGFPTLAHMPTKTARAEQTQTALATQEPQLGFDPAEATAAMEVALSAELATSADEMPDNEGQQMVVLSSGEFSGIAHEGSGLATIYELADGSHVLRFEDFEVLNGPDLHVYLAPQFDIPNTVGVELEGAVEIAALKGNVGDQNYFLPADLDVSAYQSVVIWCVPFRVPFSAAPLN